MNYKASSPKRHLNSYIHKIINYLRTKKSPVSFLELKEDLDINLMINPSLIHSLRKNPRINVTSNTLNFNPLYNLKSISDFESLLVNSKEGIEYTDLLDSSPDINKWIEELGSRVHVLKDVDQSQILFWNSLIVEKAPPEVLELFQRIKVPNYTDLVSELSQAGLKIQRAESFKKKPMLKIPGKKYKRKIKITNTHVKDLELD